MERKLIDRLCQELPNVTRSDPWGEGHDAWKVGGKMFACVGSKGLGVSLKTPDIETAQLLIEVGHAERAAYFHASWVHIPWGLVPEEELKDRLHTAYRIIRAGLPAKVRATLDPFEG